MDHKPSLSYCGPTVGRGKLLQNSVLIVEFRWS